MKTLTIFLLVFAGLVLHAWAGNPSDTELEAKARKIHEKVFTIDSHTDTPLRMMQPGFNVCVTHDPRKDHSRVDLVRMKEGGLDAAFFAVFISQGKRDPGGNARAKTEAMAIFDTIYSGIGRCPEEAGIARNYKEALDLKKAGKRAIFIGIENGYALGRDLSLVQTYYDRGARYITLCHTKNNDICDSSTDSIEHDGLSDFGRQVVAEMNRVGVMVDLSHASDQSFYDALAVSKAPVICSHSCARAVCNNPRNLDDAMLGALSAHGGVIQVCILSDYVKTPEPNPARDSARAALRKKWNNFENLTDDQMKAARKEWYALDDLYPRNLATVSDVCDHIDHIVRVAGIDHVGIGTDFDGGGGVTGCDDVSQMENITIELLRRGYSEKELAKIWGGNLMRVMKEVEEVSARLNRSAGAQ